MDNLTLSKIYAKALLNKAMKTDSAKKVLKDLTLVQKAIGNKQKQINNYFECPKVSVKEKETFVSELIAATEFLDITGMFLKILLKNDRLAYLLDITKEYEYYYYLQEGIIKAYLSYVHPLSNEDKNEIKNFLEQKTQKKIMMIYKEDKTIIGGIKVIVGNQVFDGSIKRQLEVMQDQICEVHDV